MNILDRQFTSLEVLIGALQARRLRGFEELDQLLALRCSRREVPSFTRYNAVRGNLSSRRRHVVVENCSID